MRLFCTFCWLLLALQCSSAQADYPAQIASLIDPAKMATLGERGANPRIQKAVHWLAAAQKQGERPSKVLDQAVALASYKSNAADLTKDALLRSLGIAEKLWYLTEHGLAEMRRDRSATITKGPYKGEHLSVDHIIPRAVVPEPDNVIANLELMPLSLNEKKNANPGPRQRDTARKLYAAGLLSSKALEGVLKKN
jgi:hypothetical protein